MEHTINLDKFTAGITPYGEVNTAGYVQTVDAPLPNSWTYSYIPCCHYHVGSIKSAREQVIDEILTKIVDAISKDDFKKAKELAQLAKRVKEL